MCIRDSLYTASKYISRRGKERNMRNKRAGNCFQSIMRWIKRQYFMAELMGVHLTYCTARATVIWWLEGGFIKESNCGCNPTNPRIYGEWLGMIYTCSYWEFVDINFQPCAANCTTVRSNVVGELSRLYQNTTYVVRTREENGWSLGIENTVNWYVTEVEGDLEPLAC